MYRFSSGIVTAKHAIMLLTGMPITIAQYISLPRILRTNTVEVETLVHCIMGRNKKKNSSTSNRCT